MKKTKRYFTEEGEEKEKPKKNPTKKQIAFKARNKNAQDIVVIRATLKPSRGFRNNFKEIRPKPEKGPPQFPGRAPVNKQAVAKHSRGSGIGKNNTVKTRFLKKKVNKKEKAIEWAAVQAARAELLLTQESGGLEAEPGETTTQFRQKQITENVDITAAAKQFELQLFDFGPYRMQYSRNGRHLLLGGRRGHVAAFDWVTKKLHCEINVMESVHDVSWLHIETMFAVAQKNWVYIYDNQGIELHCIKKLYQVQRMEFLPYHFLLATGSDMGYLSWLDISIGELVTQYNTKLGSISMLTQNPYNAILCMGHAKGVVSMWSPNLREPLVKMLCHRAPMTALAVNSTGTYMATASVDRTLKIWDIRKLDGPVQNYTTRVAASCLSFSQQDQLAIGMGNVVEVYRDCCTKTAQYAYLRHRMNSAAENIEFCPYEDILGIATTRCFNSILVPGAGEPNFDALEANPFQTKSQRKEAEVKSLLEKIQPELIRLDPNTIAEIDVPTLQDKVNAKKKLLHLKPTKIDYNPRNKAKGRGGSVKMARNKKIVQQESKKEFIRQKKDIQSDEKPTSEIKTKKKPNVLDRFKQKKQRK